MRQGLAVLTFATGLWAAGASRPVSITLSPENPLLFGKDTRQQVAVVAHFADGATRDVTKDAAFTSEKPAVAEVAEPGVVVARGNGGARIKAVYLGLSATTTALVQRADAPLPGSFSADVLPVLTKLGCNGGSCHGALNGKNGFKLSLFGYEPKNDYDMIVSANDGRRVNRDQPAKSLLLQKPAFETPHGGGKLIKTGSPEYDALLRWIEGGAKGEPGNERRMTGLKVSPEQIVLYGAETARRLLVTARYSDGSEADVTNVVQFRSNDDSIVAVTPAGVVTPVRGGETAIVVRGPGLAAAAKVGVVLQRREVKPLVSDNFIDRHVSAKLRDLQIPPSEPADDATFLRRASIDIIGVIPTAEEVRAFLADKRPGKRAALVDDLLKRPEYADHWGLYWGDHLSNTKQMIYNKGPYVFTRWLHDAFRENLPYDQFARRLLTSSGNMYDAPATSYFPIMKKEQDLASTTAQLFLGVSIECARCHNHPLERWSQADFNGMAAFFSQVRYKSLGPRNNERTLYVDFKREFVHPDTKQSNYPKALDGPVVVADEATDRREVLADWLTSPSNPWFAKSLVNRMWRNFMGRGFVEPVDDFRVTNPATNEPLLNELAKDFVEHGYDLHHLIRRITSSKAYQLSSTPTAANRDDTMAYSRYYPRRMIAEQMLDSISQATGVPEAFRSLYPGTKAMQLPEPEIESYFLEVFERPSRQLICERKQTTTLNQALHLIAGDAVHGKVANPKSALSQMVEKGVPQPEIIENLYLRTVSRYPSAAERKDADTAIARAGDRRRGLEDIFWALLNSKEFLYNH